MGLRMYLNLETRVDSKLLKAFQATERKRRFTDSLVTHSYNVLSYLEKNFGFSFFKERDKYSYDVIIEELFKILILDTEEVIEKITEDAMKFKFKEKVYRTAEAFEKEKPDEEIPDFRAPIILIRQLLHLKHDLEILKRVGIKEAYLI